MNLFTSLDLYCERMGPELWAEPWNAISNILIFFAGAYYWKAKGWVRLFSIVTMLTAIGSFLFHTTAQVWSMLCDVIPIYFFILFYVYFSFVKVVQFSKKISFGLVGFVILLNILIEFFLPKEILNGSAAYLPALFMLGIIWWTSWKKQLVHHRLYGVALMIFVVSLVARTFDHAICNLIPIGTHFIWHSLNGLMLFILIKDAELTD